MVFSEESLFLVLFSLFAVLGIKSEVLRMLSKCSVLSYTTSPEKVKMGLNEN